MPSNYQYGQYGAGRPYGDVFSVQTPHLDTQSQHLWQDHLLRQQQERQDSKELDDLMRSEVGKIRSTDTGAFIDAWQKYKIAKQPLYNPKVQLSPQEINRINQEANVHLAHAMQIGNQSVQAKEDAKQLIAERKSRPVAFSKDFNNRIEAYMNTPLDKLNTHPKYGDLTDRDSYYSHVNMSDLQPILDKARGKLRNVGKPTTAALDKLTNRVTSYQGYNAPLENYQYLVGGLKGEEMQAGFLNNYHYTPEEEQNIHDQYNEKVLNNPQYAEAYGANNLQFPSWADSTPIGRTAKLMAMENALTPFASTYRDEANRPTNRAAMQQDVLERIRLAKSLSNAKDAKLVNDFSTYYDTLPDTPEGKDVSEMLGGVKITTLPTGKSFGAQKIAYDAANRKVTYTDISGNKVVKSFEQFKAGLPTTNTEQDLKYVDALGSVGKPNSINAHGKKPINADNLRKKYNY